MGFKQLSFNQSDFLGLVTCWKEIVGSELAQHSIPLKNTNNILTVLTSHSAFSNRLYYMESTIKEKIYARFPDLKETISKIIFQTRTSFFKKTQSKQETREEIKEKPPIEKVHRFDPKYKQLKSEGMKLLSEIEDKKIREQFLSLYIQEGLKRKELQ